MTIRVQSYFFLFLFFSSFPIFALDTKKEAKEQNSDEINYEYQEYLKEKNLYKSKSFRLTFHLTPLFFNKISFSTDYKIHKKISLGITGSYKTKHYAGSLDIQQNKKNLKSLYATNWSAGIEANFATFHELYTNGFVITPYIVYNQTHFHGLAPTKKTFAPDLLNFQNYAASYFSFGFLANIEIFLFENALCLTAGPGFNIDSYSYRNIALPFFRASIAFVL